MSNIMNADQFDKLLKPGTSDFNGMDYPRFPEEYSHIYVERPSFRHYEEHLELSMTGRARTFPEGARAPLSTMKQGPTTVAVHQNVGIGFEITRILIKDNLYPSVFPRGYESCEIGHQIFKESQAATLFNNAFLSTKPIGDGQPLCSLNHPVTGTNGVFANKIAYNTDLNETAMNEMNIIRSGLVDPAGLQYFSQPKFVYASPQKQYNAQILAESAFRPGTNMNDVSPTKTLGMMPQGFLISHFMLSTVNKNWFELTNNNGFVYWNRQPLEPDMFTDPRTGNFMFFLVARYSFICTDARSVIGAEGI